MKTVQKIGMIIAVVLMIFAIVFPVPQKYLQTTSSYSRSNTWTDKSGLEYVGGDAYNLQMEATLKAGYMSGVMTLKSVSFIGGLILLFLSLYSGIKCELIEKQNLEISRILEANKKAGEELKGTLDNMLKAAQNSVPEKTPDPEPAVESSSEAFETPEAPEAAAGEAAPDEYDGMMLL